MKLIHISFIAIFTLFTCKGSVGESETVTDIDGNIYHTVAIGAQ